MNDHKNRVAKYGIFCDMAKENRMTRLCFTFILQNFNTL